MRLGTLVGAALGAALAFGVSAAQAEEETKGGEAKGGAEKGEKHEHEGRLPLSFTERPLTLPKLVLNPIVEFNVARVDGGTLLGSQTFVNLAIGASFGILDDLEAHVLVAPLQLSPDFAYGQVEQPGPQFGATYRFLKGELELGVRADVTVVTYSSQGVSLSGVVVTPGVPLRVHIGKEGRLDAGVFVPISSIGGSIAGLKGTTTSEGLVIPLAFAYDITEPLHVGLSTGFRIENFSPPAPESLGDKAGIPLGFFAGYAIGGKDGPILDIDPFFRWAQLFTPGATGDKVHAGDFQVGVELGGFLYF